MYKEQKYKVMVVEDEPIILNYLVTKIKELPLPLTVSSQAANGEDALELIRQCPPDIVFTDVKMPVMNGLQLANKIHEEYPDILMVIISGYEDFEYAQLAIQYNVSDYLLKPVNYDKLFSITDKLCQKLSQRYHSVIKEFIDLAMSGNVAQTESDAAGDFFVFLIKAGNLYTKQAEHMVYDSIRTFWKSASLFSWLSNYFSQNTDWWLSDIKEFSYRMLITRTNYPDLRTHLFDYLNKTQCDCFFNVCLCEYPETIPLIQLRQAIQSLSDDINHRLIPCFSQEWTLQPGTAHSIPLLNSCIFEKLIILLKSGHISALEKYLDSLLKQWQNEKAPQVFLSKYLLELFSFLSKHNACSATQNEMYSSVSSIFALCHSDDQLYGQLHGLVMQWVINPMYESHNSMEVYQQIKQYIEEYYQQEITMESLSEVFHFSLSYISRVFKKYGKQPPIKYLIQIRMQKAGNLMKAHPEMDIKIIAELVGYSNQHYFSRYFKQYFAATPSEYKKNICKQLQNFSS